MDEGLDVVIKRWFLEVEGWSEGFFLVEENVFI